MPRLLFVYNADAGLISAAWDAGHKLLSPATYPCALCAITHGALTMRKEWKEAVAHFPHPATFLHRDEFLAEYPEASVPLPAVLLEGGGTLTTIVPAQAMRLDQSVADLVELVEAGLAAQPGQRA